MKKLRARFPVSWRDTLIFALILTAAIAVCGLLIQLDATGGFAAMVFVLAVVFIARFTSGYLYGVLASLVGVVVTNYVFTYPYWTLDFSIAGYPLTFLSMMTVSLVISTLTSRTKAHEQLRIEAEKEIMRANLLRAISHDLRTPLTSIIGSSSVILENGDRLSEEKKKEMLRRVQDEARWLINMVENLLSITRMNNENALLNKQPEVMEEVVGGAVQKFRKHYDDMQVVIRPPEQIAVVCMDAMLIEQVLLNVMENAVIHGKNTTRITISLRQDSEQVYVVVSDNGGGVDPKLLPHILEDSFSAIRVSQTDSRRCMGIGLTVCRTIVASHGGSITVRNTEEGAEFSIHLPLEQEGLEDV